VLNHRSQRYLCAAFATLSFSLTRVEAATTTLLDLNFNSSTTAYVYFASTALSPSSGNISPTTTLANNGFPTAPTSGYLALTPNASAVTAASFYGGWAANVTLGSVNSPYTAGGFGQTDLSKVSFTAKVRARGMPASGGAVVILKLHATGDNPNAVPGGYKRIMFEPVFLSGNDWTTIGGTLDTAGLTSGKGTSYNFPIDAATYTALIELSGFNRLGTAGYTAYANNPTVAASGGRKNPGFDLTASNIRVEIDDVKLVVTDAATTGYIAATTPAQLLRNGNFVQGEANWTVFEGAYVNSSDPYSEDGSTFLFWPGWSGSAYAGAMQQGISFNSANGDYFTATFRAKFETNYKASSTIVSFMDSAAIAEYSRTDLSEDISKNLGQWQTYKASFKATASQLAAGAMTLKIQPLGRNTSGAEFSSLIVDDVVLSQATSASVGPQIKVKVDGAQQADNSTATLVSPLVGKTTPYSVKIENQGAENLTISSATLSGTGFSLVGTGTGTLAPGASTSITVRTTPSSIAAVSGSLTIVSNDKEASDQTYVVNLTATPVNLSDSFNSSESPSQLGWVPSSSRAGILTSSTTTVSGGAMQINIDSSTGDYPWSYALSKTFASPGTLDLATSSLLVSLKASGVFEGMTQNKVQVRLESLNSALAVTGSIQLGSWVDETSPANYFAGDGINDRVVILIPEGGSSFTQAGGTLASTGVKSAGFDTAAPYFRLVVQATDFEFDNDNNNVIEVDSVTLSLGVSPFTLTNGSFESDSTDVGTAAAPTSWIQYPAEGVSKNTLANGAKIYNQTTKDDDTSIVSSAFAGTKVMKVYGQNYYPGGVWQGPSQTGAVYQEFPLNTTPSLIVGATIHARGMAKVFSIDPLTSGSTFNYGFKYMDQGNIEIGRSVTTLTSANFSANKWVPLTVNGTVPAGTAKVQLVSEFVQTSSSGNGAVYLDDLSIGFGAISPTATVGANTYSLVWSDEFDGTALNTANWTPETGGGGWGNNEQQTYTSDSANLRVDSGNLIIQAVKSGSSWTSARIKSQGLRSYQYGKIEFRAKLPTGVGPWPAAWLLGNNISSVNWPACGEIDVMEWRGGFNGVANGDANTVGHALHSATRNGSSPVEPTSRSAVVNPSSAFHTYAVVWTANNLVFSVDGVDKATLTPPTADAAAFQKEFFLILNLAMGGSYVGNTIASSVTAATYEVDYVRVYQAASATVTAPATPAAPTFASVTSTGFTVNWGAVSGATSYKLDVSTSSTFATYFTQDLTVSGTSQAVTGLSPGTTYYARVRAVNSGGTSASSTTGTQATTASAPSVPATPTFSSVSSTGFTVNWVAVSGATSYRLDVSTSSTFATYFSQNLTVSGTSQAVTGLSPGTTYYARVRAVNSGGTSASSSNGTQATLTSYQQYLSGLGYSTSTAFDADANGDGVKEGIKYAFNAASPQLGSSPATIVRSGSTLTYTFDIRNDTNLSLNVQFSNNLSAWTTLTGSTSPTVSIAETSGAAAGYTRKIVTIPTTEPKAFVRLQVTGN
jgi:beta-glucanase (GH16 family)